MNAAVPTRATRKLVKTLKASQKISKLIPWYMAKAKMAEYLPWKKSAWVTSSTSVELLWGFDIFPLHPENNACISGVRRISLDLIEHAESLGFSRDACSYMKTNVGAYDKKIGIKMGGIAKPDFMLTAGSICDTHVKWFQIQAQRMDVPIFVFDVPHVVNNTSEETKKRYREYLVKQTYDYIDFVESTVGKRFNEKKLLKTWNNSARLSNLWQDIYEYRKKIPSPVGYADTLGDIFPLVLLPGIKKGIKYFEELLKEVKEYVALGKGALPKGEEKYRLMFEGIPMWYRIKFFHQLMNYGAVVTYEPYTYSFGSPKPHIDTLEEGLNATADLMMYQPYFYNLSDRIAYFKDIIQKYHIDGVLLHENMSCRPSCTGMYDLKQSIQQELGIPVLLFSCDMNDPRAYGEEQMQTRIEGFMEILEQSKKR
ncbi:MAG: 2-hydroxyacyl-CoA dehydratase subunit D [Promethearchaeota archaeon]